MRGAREMRKQALQRGCDLDEPSKKTGAAAGQTGLHRRLPQVCVQGRGDPSCVRPGSSSGSCCHRRPGGQGVPGGRAAAGDRAYGGGEASRGPQGVQRDRASRGQSHGRAGCLGLGAGAGRGRTGCQEGLSGATLLASAAAVLGARGGGGTPPPGDFQAPPGLLPVVQVLSSFKEPRR